MREGLEVHHQTRVPAGVGTYGIGITPILDPETMHLKVSPGVVRLLDPEIEGLSEELIFPGCEVDLPKETINVWIAQRRSDRMASLLVNVGLGIDSVTYRVLYPVVLLEYVGWVLYHWRLTERDLERWKATKYKVPPDPGQFSGKDVAIEIVTEYPEHIKHSIEERNKKEEAKNALRILLRKGDKWSDKEKEQALRDLVVATGILDEGPSG